MMGEGSGAGKALRLERHALGVLHVVFDSPGESVNTLDASFADDFTEIFEQIEADSSISCVVMRSGKADGFIAGANIDMLEAVTSAEQAVGLSRLGQRAVERIASCRVPVVAAIHGPCLGGGLEIALAARGRVASAARSTKLGLPEVQLGILPGMGGTQRLPRLVGLTAALDLLLSGKQIDARKARALGLVDEVVPPSVLIDVAEKRALQLTGKKGSGRSSLASLRELLSPLELKELALAENPLGRKVVFDQARKRLLARTQGNYPAPERILDVVRLGLWKGEREGLEAEARAFGDLVVSPEARALRHVFFSQQALKKDPGTDGDAEGRTVRQVGVLGGGLMGAGIAYASVTSARCLVRLKEVRPEGLSAALRSVDKLLEERALRRRISVREKAQLLAKITRSLDYSGFESLDVVIEAVFEDLDLKRAVLSEVLATSSETTIFASNTSSLPIAEIAAGCAAPERVIGMHYFSPVHKMPLLEIITTERTADWVTRTCVSLGKRQGKTVIVVRDGPGFYTTRILGPYLNEATRLVLEGWPVQVVDRALVLAGFPVGPLVLLDEIGIDVGAKVVRVLEAGVGSRLAPPAELQKLLEAGRLGRKNGRGFYDYTHRGRSKRPVDDSVYADLGLPLPNREDSRGLAESAGLANRCLLSMVNEALHCMGEEILRSERDGDIGAVFGLGFPPFLGGPFHFVRSRGPARVLAELEALCEEHGERFLPAPYLASLVSRG